MGVGRRGKAVGAMVLERWGSITSSGLLVLGQIEIWGGEANGRGPGSCSGQNGKVQRGNGRPVQV